MLREWDWVISHADKLTTVAILVILVVSMIHIIRHLYKRSEACESARLEDANERGVLKQTLGKLEGKVETMEENLAVLHKQTLEFVVNSRREDES